MIAGTSTTLSRKTPSRKFLLLPLLPSPRRSIAAALPARAGLGEVPERLFPPPLLLLLLLPRQVLPEEVTEGGAVDAVVTTQRHLQSRNRP